MADHRKSFRPRRLKLDGRLLPRGRVLGAALVLAGLLAAPAALAQDLGLKRGEESLAAGQYETAIRQLSATVNNEKSTPEQAAQALYLRGIAFRKVGQTGRAVADLGAAVWLGLPSSDRARALVNKGLAYRAAGLAGQSEAALSEARRIASAGEVERIIAQDGAAAVADAGSESFTSEGSSSSGESVWSRIVPSFGSSSGETSAPAPQPQQPQPQPQQQQQNAESTETAEAAPSTGWSASVSDAAAEEQGGNRVSRWFGSLTGDGAPAPAAAPPAAPAPPPSAPPAAQTTAAPKTAAGAPPSTASWAANTQTTTAEAESESGTAIGRWFSRATDGVSAPAATEAAPSVPRGGGYTVQLANSRSQAEAQALWKQAQRSNRQLASASPRIEKVDIGSFGTFYSVKIGPFAGEAESTSLCNALKRSGTDCSVVSPDGP